MGIFAYFLQQGWETLSYVSVKTVVPIASDKLDLA